MLLQRCIYVGTNVALTSETYVKTSFHHNELATLPQRKFRRNYNVVTTFLCQLGYTACTADYEYKKIKDLNSFYSFKDPL